MKQFWNPKDAFLLGEISKAIVVESLGGTTLWRDATGYQGCNRIPRTLFWRPS